MFFNNSGLSFSSKGQVTVEYILLAFVSLILMQLIFSRFKDENYLAQFVSGPNPIIANMMENGVWELNRTAARNQHPNQNERHLSWDP